MTPEDEQEAQDDQQRIAEKREKLLAQIHEMQNAGGGTPDEREKQVDADREAGRETRDQRRTKVRGIRAEQWERICPKRYVEASLAAIDSAQIRSIVTEWLADADTNIVLLGNQPGAGKTFIARAIARELFIEGLGVEFHQVGELFDGLTPNSPDTALFDRVKNVPYLFLDDLGASRLTEWREDRLQSLLSYRWDEELPLVVTSNLSSGDLEEWLGSRAYSRLAGGALVLAINGKDKRFV